MSDFKDVIKRSMLDGEFLDLLLVDPSSALEDYEISDEDRMAIVSRVESEMEDAVIRNTDT